MPAQRTIKIKRGTQEALDLAAASGRLQAFELYYLTDKNVLIVGLGSSSESTLTHILVNIPSIQSLIGESIGRSKILPSSTDILLS